MQKLIVTTYKPKSPPDRRYDWKAVREDWDEGDPIGYGQRELDAIHDLEEAERLWMED